eukprot:g5550.t2
MRACGPPVHAAPAATAALFLFFVFFNGRGEASLLKPPSASSAMLTLISTGSGRHSLLCSSRRLSRTKGATGSHGCGVVRGRHGGGSTTHRCGPLCALSSVEGRSKQLLPSIAAPPQGSSTRLARPLGSFAVSTTEMGASARPPSEQESTVNRAEIAAGMRVRLRDTGRLGTVVGKKAGGWWKVDLLDPWNGGNTTELADGGAAAGGNCAATSTTASGLVSTRRGNMEALGNAYASSSSWSSEATPAAVAVATAPPAASTVGARKRRFPQGKISSSSSGGSGRATTTWADDTATATTVPAARGKTAAIKRRTTKKAGAGATIAASPGVVPPSLVGQTISVEMPAPAMASATAAAPRGGGEAVAVTIGKMSSEGLAHAAMKEWLVFSDLHVSPGSLAVTLEALDRVNEEAMKRAACGIAFLGDFWHARGSLKVDLLVPVMKQLATWTRPVVMIPGNHDQVTLGGGVHALTPLQFAFTDPKQALVLSEPTLFLDALWIPHRRNNADMEALLGSEEARGARAIFCHVDIKGAAMNDGISSYSGIPRSAFPNNVPTFSGHFHKPHTVGGRDGFIRYVGSPYQTSLSESGQSKALIVLDAETWEETAVIPLDIGRRFFRVKGEHEPLPTLGEVSPGDRVVWTVKDAGSDDVRRRAEALQKEMVEVEIREEPRPFPVLAPSHFAPGPGSDTIGAAAARSGNGTLDLGAAAGVNGVGCKVSTSPDSASLSPDALFRAYLERERGVGGRNVSEEVEKLGFSLIKDLGQQTPSKKCGREDRHTSLALHSIKLKNFGPFRDEVTYPLDERGVVLLRGSNLDDSGADSNGAGKTTLAMSALWALAGVVDARPVSDGRVADVVHEGTRARSPSSIASLSSFSSSSTSSTDGGEGAEKPGDEGARPRSTVAEATLTGTLNGKPLWLKRRKGARVNQLFLEHDGEDLTRQIAKETQVVLEDDLGLSPHVLGRGIFQGQHHLNGLLESTDAQLKEDLALLVPMDTWQDLASRSRATARKSDEDAARFRERAVTRREDLARLTEELQRARECAATAAAATTEVLHTVSKGDQQSKQDDSSSATTTAAVVNRNRGALGDKQAPAVTVEEGKAPGVTAASTEKKQGTTDVDGYTGGTVSQRLRVDARQARDDAEVAEEALRVLRLKLERLAEDWTDLRMRLMGEAKAARERVTFLRRDVQREEEKLSGSKQAVVQVQEKLVHIRNRDPDLWAELASLVRLSEQASSDQPAAAVAAAVVADELQYAEELASASRASLADAQAALRHATDAVRAHSGLEMVGEGTCHTCGQPVAGNIIHERGEILRVSETVAEAQLVRFEREAKVADRSLELTRGKVELLSELAGYERDKSEALGREREGEEELRARRDELRQVEHEATVAEARVEEQAQREASLRREWAGKTKAAEWALKAHRDKQTFAQNELAEAVAREAELQLISQAKEAEKQRLLQAEEVAVARVREMETKVDGLRRELEEVEEKEKEASALKATSTALAEHLGVRGVQNFVFRDAVNQLEANVARYLDALSDGALQLRLSMDGDRVVKRASARAADGGFRDRSLSQLSGGQWRRASLSLELAFVELARQRGRFSCNLLVLDEVLSQLDSYGRERVANMLRALTRGRNAYSDSHTGPTQAMYSTILVVLQDLPADELQESFDAIDEVVKHRDSSSVVVDRRIH